MWGICSQLLQQIAAAALTYDEGYLLTAAPPDLEHGVASLDPPAPMQPLLLGAILHRNLECWVHESRQIGSGQTGDGKSEPSVF